MWPTCLIRKKRPSSSRKQPPPRWPISEATPRHSPSCDRTSNEDPMNAGILTTRVADGIAVITLGRARRIYFDEEIGDALTETLDGFAGDPNVRVVIVTGGAPGYFNRHFNIPVLTQIAESLRASGRQWPENATYNGGFFDKAMALCESMPKPVIAAISGTALAGAFEFALSCDLRIAEDGDYLIGLPEAELGL